MRRLAGGLEQLETLERGLARLRDVRERVRRFHQRTYSAYARAVVRERADALRQAQTAVDNAAERLRTTTAELEAERKRAERASEERNAAQARLDTLTAEEHALVTSAAWSSVAEIETLREHRRTPRHGRPQPRDGHADDAATAAGALEAELITARAAAAERREGAIAELDALLELAADAGLERRATILAEQLRSGSLAADTWSPLLRELVGDWRDVLHRHRELVRELRQAAASAERARADERDAAARARTGGSEAISVRATARGDARSAHIGICDLAVGARPARVGRCQRGGRPRASAGRLIACCRRCPLSWTAAGSRSLTSVPRMSSRGRRRPRRSRPPRRKSRDLPARTTTGRGLRNGSGPTARSATAPRCGG